MEKRIHKKRKYSRPQLEVIDVDHEISLMMMSVENPPGLGASSMETPPESGPVSTYSSSEEKNPFGGSSPDYSN